MALIHEFKNTDPREEKRQMEERRKQQSAGSHYSIFKVGVESYRFKEGANMLRFLPQRTSSPYNNWLEIDVLNFYRDEDKVRGSFRVMDTSINGLLNRVRKVLKRHPEFKMQLASKTNPDGISLSTRPKVVFLGFDVKAEEKKVYPILLPGTLPYPMQDGRPRKPQAGTIITNFCTDEDMHGELRYGSIFSALTGRVIRVDCSQVGTQYATYAPTVDVVMSLEDERFEPVLQQVKNFDEYIKETTEKELIDLLRQYLPKDMYQLINDELGLDDLEEEEEEHATGVNTTTVIDPFSMDEEEELPKGPPEPQVVTPDQVVTPVKQPTEPVKSESKPVTDQASVETISPTQKRLEEMRASIQRNRQAH